MSVQEYIEEFCNQLRRKQITGSLATGRRTAELLRIYISQHKHADPATLIEDVRGVGTKMQTAKPLGMYYEQPLCHGRSQNILPSSFTLIFCRLRSISLLF